jgi:hypothetical protein
MLMIATSKHVGTTVLLLSLYLATAATTASTPDSTPISPRDAVSLVEDAARAWEPDAVLVYLENDETLSITGHSSRWGYLVYSPAKDQARGYSVRGQGIVAAHNLQFKFEAPPLPATWIDSAEALEAADKKAGAKYREENGGEPTTLLLMRGAFDEKEPDLTTWTVIYSSPTAPSLFVMVDATSGKVKRMWRG